MNKLRNKIINSELTLKQNNNPDIQKKVFDEQLNLLHKNLKLSIPANLLCAMIILIALYQESNKFLIWAWYIAMLSISLIRIGMGYVLQKKHSFTNLHFFILFTVASAALWGIAASLLMPQGNLLQQMIVIIILAGVTAGSIQTLQASLVASILYVIVSIFPLCIWFLFQKETIYYLLSMAMTTYLFFMILTAKRSHALLVQMLHLGYENLDLVANLSNTNKQLEQTFKIVEESEKNLRIIQDNAPIGMAIVSVDGKWLRVNNKLCEIFGYNREELEQLTYQELTHPDDRAITLNYTKRLLQGEISAYQLDKRYINKNGQTVWALLNVSLIHDVEGKYLYFIKQLQDISERKESEQVILELNKLNKLLQLCQNSTEAYTVVSRAATQLFFGYQGGLAIFNKITQAQERVESWGETTFLKEEFTSENCWALRIGKPYVVNDLTKDIICQHFISKPPHGYICLPLIVQNEVLGLLNFNAMTDSPITSKQQQIMTTFSEFIKLSLANIRMKEALREKAIYDSLTGLFNKSYLEETLPREIKHSLRTKKSLCVGMLSVDHFEKFKEIDAGKADVEVLKFIASLLKNNFRGSDIICRYQADTFVIVLLDTGLTGALPRLEFVRQAAKKSRLYFKTQLLPQILLSIGVVEVPNQASTVNEIIRLAEETLQAAKINGDNVMTAQMVIA